MEEVKIAEKSNKNRYILKNLAAFFIWTYILIKLFIFDIDIYLINKFLPEYKWIMNIKFFILLFVVALFLIFIKNKNIILYMLYILFYPFILLFWKIPFQF